MQTSSWKRLAGIAGCGTLELSFLPVRVGRLHLPVVVGHKDLKLWEVLLTFEALQGDLLDVLALLVYHLEDGFGAPIVSPVLVVALRHFKLVERELDVNPVAHWHVLDDCVPAAPLRGSQDVPRRALRNVSTRSRSRSRRGVD